MDVKVEVRGIRELNRAFKAVDSELPKRLKVRFLAIAETVAGSARSKLTGNVKNPTGKAAGSIRAKASARGAAISFGGSKAEYEPWLDFGGRVGRNRSVSRPLVSGGRYVYPAIAEHSDEIREQTEDAINDVARQAGFETRKGI